jgi:hypothetical protein
MEENKSRFRAGPEAWRALLEELASSGMSAAAFCRERAIPVWQMRRRLRNARPGADARRGFVEIGRGGLDPAEGVWVEAGRFRIRVGRGFDASLLRRVAEALA